MRTIVHLSDLHFGALNEVTIRPLIDALDRLRPDVVVVSGDLTQRARTSEFIQARAFLDTLSLHRIVVPGNHDVPLHNPFSRFLGGLARYRRYITADLEPFWIDTDIAIAGLNTARSWAFKGGRVSEAAAARIAVRFRAAAPGITRIIVAHHPFDLPEGLSRRQLVGRAQRMMELLAESGVDMFLTGHLHTSRTGSTAARYHIHGHSAVIVQAGTATSSRRRGEENSFNVVRIEGPGIAVQCYRWNATETTFDTATTEFFERADDGWMPKNVR